MIAKKVKIFNAKFFNELRIADDEHWTGHLEESIDSKREIFVTLDVFCEIKICYFSEGNVLYHFRTASGNEVLCLNKLFAEPKRGIAFKYFTPFFSK